MIFVVEEEVVEMHARKHAVTRNGETALSSFSCSLRTQGHKNGRCESDQRLCL